MLSTLSCGIQRFKDLRTYVKLDAELRCKILHALLEKQLSELDGRVGEEVRSLDSDVLRLLPYGYDADMTTYWYHSVKRII